MTYRLIGYGHPTIDGQYVKSFDPEANDGRGDAEFTYERAEALGFPDFATAFEFWRQQSKTRPLREDGKPNRPLTTFTIQIIPDRAHFETVGGRWAL